MSFYQPSLSLYDVLNALVNQNHVGNGQEAEQQQGQFAHPHVPPHATDEPHGYHHHVHNPQGQAFGFSKHDPFQSMFGPLNRGFSRLPQQGYYYSPQFAYDDYDDEDENAEDEDMHYENGKDEENNEEKETPFYYHKNSGRYNRDYNEQPTLTDILNALMGGNLASSNQPKKEEKSEKDQESSESKSSKIPESVPEVKSTVEEPEIDTSKAQDDSTDKFGKSTKLSSHLQAPFSVSDSLQISKPESRMDLPFSPEVNVYDLDKEYLVVLALPGANSKSFKVDYHPSSHELLVKGKVVDRLGIDEQHLKITEIKYGEFERTVKFPVLPRIKDEEIKATYSNSLLQIKVPKQDITEKPKPKKRIAIEEIPDAELEFEENPNPVQKY